MHSNAHARRTVATKETEEECAAGICTCDIGVVITRDSIVPMPPFNAVQIVAFRLHKAEVILLHAKRDAEGQSGLLRHPKSEREQCVKGITGRLTGTCHDELAKGSLAPLLSLSGRSQCMAGRGTITLSH